MPSWINIYVKVAPLPQKKELCVIGLLMLVNYCIILWTTSQDNQMTVRHNYYFYINSVYFKSLAPARYRAIYSLLVTVWICVRRQFFTFSITSSSFPKLFNGGLYFWGLQIWRSKICNSLCKFLLQTHTTIPRHFDDILRMRGECTVPRRCSSKREHSKLTTKQLQILPVDFEGKI